MVIRSSDLRPFHQVRCNLCIYLVSYGWLARSNRSFGSYYLFTHQKKKTIMVNISQQLRLEFQPGHPGLKSVELETEGLHRKELRG